MRMGRRVSRKGVENKKERIGRVDRRMRNGGQDGMRRGGKGGKDEERMVKKRLEKVRKIG